MHAIWFEHFSKTSLKLAVAAILVIITTATTAHAAVTYVDASRANTDNAAGGDDSTWVDGDDGTTGGTITDGEANADGLWRFRSTIESGIIEATGSNATAEDAVEIVTTVTGLADGLYNAYIFFIPVSANPTGADLKPMFPIRAGFTSNPNANQLFDQFGTLEGSIAGQDASLLTFDVPPPPGSGTRTLLYGLIGQTTVSGGSLSVYVDDFPANSDPDFPNKSNTRTWYQGIGYEPVTAQPGDFDGDGDVDGADFVAWQTNFPKAENALLEEGDADGDGDVDGADFVVWQTNFPFTPGGGASPVPEPSSVILAGVCGLLLLARHRSAAR